METLSDMINKFKHSIDQSKSQAETLYTMMENVSDLNDAELALIYSAVHQCPTETMMESTYASKAITKLEEEIQNRYNRLNSVKWEYYYAPYFTENEVKEKLGYFTEKWHREGPGRHYSNYERVDPSIYRNRIQELEELIKSTENPDTLAALKDELIRLGWNPEIECTPDNMIKAATRITNEYANIVSEYFFIDCISMVSSVQSIKEQNNLKESVPVFMIVYENTEEYQFGSLNIDSFSDMMNKADIYVVYLNSQISLDPKYLASVMINENRVFNLPSNIRAALMVDELCANGGVCTTIERPYVKLLYSGLLAEANIDNINKFVNIASGNPYVEPIGNMAPYSAYISTNKF